MDIDNNTTVAEANDSQPDLNRRGFIGKAGKAIYIAPTLTLLGAAKATAQFPSPPCDPGGGTCSSPAAAPTPAAPTE